MRARLRRARVCSTSPKPLGSPAPPLARAVPKAAAAAAGTPDKVTLNFYLPHSIEFQGQKARAGPLP